MYTTDVFPTELGSWCLTQEPAVNVFVPQSCSFEWSVNDTILDMYAVDMCVVLVL